MPSLTTQAKDQFIDLVISKVRGLVEGAEQDIVNYGTAIASDALAAATEPDQATAEKLLAELGAQAAVLLEVHRIRLNHERINTLQDTLVFGVKVLRAAVL